MSYQNVTWGPFTCPPSSTQYPTNWFTVSGGTIISVGFQNMGLTSQLSASQVFTPNPTACSVQVCNTSSAEVSWSAWAVVDNGTGGNVTTVNSAISTSSI